ncbi:MAG: hypothetical protein FWE53_05050 [Firmicutes bacterium]|nr:hypothetical protein [Bacillota bacterium]
MADEIVKEKQQLMLLDSVFGGLMASPHAAHKMDVEAYNELKKVSRGSVARRFFLRRTPGHHRDFLVWHQRHRLNAEKLMDRLEEGRSRESNQLSESSQARLQKRINKHNLKYEKAMTKRLKLVDKEIKRLEGNLYEDKTWRQRQRQRLGAAGDFIAKDRVSGSVLRKLDELYAVKSMISGLYDSYNVHSKEGGHQTKGSDSWKAVNDKLNKEDAVQRGKNQANATARAAADARQKDNNEYDKAASRVANTLMTFDGNHLTRDEKGNLVNASNLNNNQIEEIRRFGKEVKDVKKAYNENEPLKADGKILESYTPEQLATMAAKQDMSVEQLTRMFEQNAKTNGDTPETYIKAIFSGRLDVSKMDEVTQKAIARYVVKAIPTVEGENGAKVRDVEAVNNIQKLIDNTTGTLGPENKQNAALYAGIRNFNNVLTDATQSQYGLTDQPVAINNLGLSRLYKAPPSA